MNYSKGISWIDDCRIPFTNDKDIPNDMDKTYIEGNRNFIGVGGYKPFLYKQNNTGRFPANLLCCDDVLNDGSISNGSDHKIKYREYKNFNNDGFSLPKYRRECGYSDKGTNSRYYDIDKWFDYLLDKLQNDTDGTIC